MSPSPADKPRVIPADCLVGREGLEPPTPGLKAWHAFMIPAADAGFVRGWWSIGGWVWTFTSQACSVLVSNSCQQVLWLFHPEDESRVLPT